MKNYRGQILIELLVAIAVTAVVIGGVTELLGVSKRTGKDVSKQFTAIRLAEETLEAVRVLRDANWHNLYDSIHGTQEYYPKMLVSAWVLTTNPTDKMISLDEVDYERWIVIENVERDMSGSIAESGGTDDPSTQKVTVTVRTSGLDDFIVSRYFTRFKNDVFAQTDWVGGSGQAGPITVPNNMYWSDDGNVDVTSVPGSIKLKSL